MTRHGKAISYLLFMKITRGLFDHIVLQRNKRNVSDAIVEGAAESTGPVVATVKQRGKTVKGFNHAVVGAAKRGKFTARLAGIPVGGPYDIELSVGGETLAVRDVLVGEVWLLGGQSNMQGSGLQTGAAKPKPLVRAFYMNDKWAVAKDPIHNMDATVDEVHVKLMGGVRPPAKNKVTGVGPGVAFGQEMQRLTGVPQGVIACGHGGTSMSQWDPKLKKLGSGSLYGATIRRFVKNGSSVSGLVWYQGESDAHEEGMPLYTQRMKEFVAALRRDTRIKDLPVAIMQLSRVLGQTPPRWVFWNSVQEQERLLPKSIKRLTVVPAIDLTLDDSIHISGVGQQVAGKRLVQAMAAMIYGRKMGLPPIELKSVKIARSTRDTAEVVAEFDNVVGKLRAGGRPYGFELGTPTPGNSVYEVQLDGRRAIVKTTLSHRDIEGKYLWYGAGTDPYCNITDEGGRSLPVFGPVPLGTPRAVTPFIRTVRVSKFQPSAGKLQTLRLPKDLKKLGMKQRTFDADFCDMHMEIGRRAPEDNVILWAFKFTCDEPMRLAALLGYDGPCKAWLDGKQVFHDPKGTNPALPTDKGRAVFRAAKGAHEIVVALGTNKAAAWGLYMRLERLGVPKRLLAKGFGAYKMPKILG